MSMLQYVSHAKENENKISTCELRISFLRKYKHDIYDVANTRNRLLPDHTYITIKNYANVDKCFYTVDLEN